MHIKLKQTPIERKQHNCANCKTPSDLTKDYFYLFFNFTERMAQTSLIPYAITNTKCVARPLQVS